METFLNLSLLLIYKNEEILNLRVHAEGPGLSLKPGGLQTPLRANTKHGVRSSSETIILPILRVGIVKYQTN